MSSKKSSFFFLFYVCCSPNMIPCHIPVSALQEVCEPTSLHNGDSTDPSLKDSWRLDGSQEERLVENCV